MSSNLKVNTILPSTGTTVTVSGISSVTSSISAGSSITGTTFYGSGANLTSLPSQLTLSNNADNRVITGGSGTNLNGEANLIYNGTGLGVGETSPANLLHVKVSDAGIAPHPSAQIVLERSGTNYLQFLTAANGTSGLLFGDTNDIDVAKIVYDHNVPAMQFVTETVERLRIDSSGRLLVGSTSTNQNVSKIVVKASSPSNVYDNHLYLEGSETSGDADTGGVLGFGGHDGGSSFRNWANILGMKENSTDGNTASYIAFHTRAAGGNPAEKLRIASGGQVIIGDDDTDKANGHFDDLIVGANASTTETHGITIVCGNAATNGGIAFSDGSNGGADAYRGMISYQHNDNHMQFRTNATERLRLASSGQIGIAGANYGTARETIVSGGASAAISWSANPFVIDMVGLGDIDYGKMFVRYRETATVSGNGLIYLGICKSTTNCPAGRAGTPIGFIPSTTYNGHFRVDKIGITPWPDGSGHRYEYYAIISDYASSGKLGVFYLTNTTS